MNLYEVTGLTLCRAIIIAPHYTAADELCPFYASEIRFLGRINSNSPRVLLATHERTQMIRGTEEEVLDVIDDEGVIAPYE